MLRIIETLLWLPESRFTCETLFFVIPRKDNLKRAKSTLWNDDRFLFGIII
jgi:hypothetical protein